MAKYLQKQRQAAQNKCISFKFWVTDLFGILLLGIIHECVELVELDKEHENVFGGKNESNGSSSARHQRYMKYQKHYHGDGSIVQSLNQLVENKLRMISLGTLLTLIVDISQYAVMNVCVLGKSFHR